MRLEPAAIETWLERAVWAWKTWPNPVQHRVTYRVLRQFREQINSGYVGWYHLPHSERARAEYTAYSDANHKYCGQLLFEAGERVTQIGNLRGRWLFAQSIANWLQRYADSQRAVNGKGPMADVGGAE